MASLGLPSPEAFDAWLPKCEFESQEAAELALKTFALTHGFSIATQVSWPNRRYPSKWMRCTKGGAPRNRVPVDDRVRNRKSRRTECPFVAEIHQTKKRTWTLHIQNAHHNHARDMAGSGLAIHSSQRGFTAEEKAHIAMEVRKAVAEGNIPPSKPLFDWVHENNPNSRTTMRDVLNAIQKVKDALVKEDPEKWTDFFDKQRDRKCGYCDQKGHTKLNCEKRLQDRANGVEEGPEIGKRRQKAAQRAKEKEAARRKRQQEEEEARMAAAAARTTAQAQQQDRSEHQPPQQQSQSSTQAPRATRPTSPPRASASHQQPTRYQQPWPVPHTAFDPPLTISSSLSGESSLSSAWRHNAHPHHHGHQNGSGHEHIYAGQNNGAALTGFGGTAMPMGGAWPQAAPPSYLSSSAVQRGYGREG